VLDAYGRGCAVTTEHSLPVLDAAHIKPYAEGGQHAIQNGLVLRSDLHRLFDRGYITVDHEDRLVVGRRLRDEFENGRTYYALEGRRLVLPEDPALRPDRDALAWHRDRAFLG
jgi:putative restriction endonuclease